MEDNAVAQFRKKEAPGVGRLEISVLGTPQVLVDGAPLEVDTRKAVALLVYLAVTGRPQARDRLSGLLWPEYDTEHARAALRRTLSSLRKALADRWISADRLAVALAAEDVSLDLTRFRSLIAATGAHGHSGEACGECTQRLAEAVALHGGSFLQGFSLRDAESFEEWQSLESEAAERELRAAMDTLLRMLVASGDLVAAVEVAEQKLALDPLDEPVHRELMELYAWRGMRAAALQQYRECVLVLDRELGVSPLPETTALYRAIGEGSVGAIQETKLPQPPPEPQVSPPGAYPLTGRDAELGALVEAYEGIGSRGALVLLEGEAGIGKTRLATDFFRSPVAAGARIVSARAHEGESGLPYALMAQVVSTLLDMTDRDQLPPDSVLEAARLVPALADAKQPPSSIQDPGALTRFYEGVRHLLAAALRDDKFGVLFLDDLQWSDGPSAELLGYMVRRLDDTPILIIAALRNEDLTADHPLRALQLEAARTKSTRRVRLERLHDRDVLSLVKDAHVEGMRPDVAERLVRETEGNPFFVVEYLNALAANVGETWKTPGSVTDLLASRASGLGPIARQVMGGAAVIDRSFDFEIVLRVAGRTELETVDALDELVAHGVVAVSKSTPDAIYEFTHDKLREYVYQQMSPARRRVLHRRVAEALESVTTRSQLSARAALIARHLEIGGRPSDAARYHHLAAEHARQVFANRDALEHYLTALSLGHPEPDVLHEGAGDMQVLVGSYSEAIDSYEAAAALAVPDRLPMLERKLGEVHMRRGDWDLSQSHFAVALEASGHTSDEAMDAVVLASMSFNAHRVGDLEQAVELGTRALAAAAQSTDPRSLAFAHNQLGLLENARGRLPQAKAHLDESLRLAIELGDYAGRAAALNNLAQTARAEGAFDRALELTHEALDLSTEQGDAHRAAALHNNIADLLREKGDIETAMEHLKEATAVLAQIGDEPAGPLPEVWKLAAW